MQKPSLDLKELFSVYIAACHVLYVTIYQIICCLCQDICTFDNNMLMFTIIQMAPYIFAGKRDFSSFYQHIIF